MGQIKKEGKGIFEAVGHLLRAERANKVFWDVGTL